MRLRTGLLAALAYVLLLAILALGVPLASSLSARVNDEVRSQAQGQADLVAATAADLLSRARRSELAVLTHTAAAAVRGRVLVVDRSGIVLADSAGPAQLGASYAARPEIIERACRPPGAGAARESHARRGNPRDGCADHPQPGAGGGGAGDPERGRCACRGPAC